MNSSELSKMFEDLEKITHEIIKRYTFAMWCNEWSKNEIALTRAQLKHIAKQRKELVKNED